MADNTSGHSDEERLLDHNYDGIQEYDNPMPRWWVWIFWATIVYSLLYVFDFTGKIRGPGRMVEYSQAMALAEQNRPVDAALLSEGELLALVSDPATVEAGKTAFVAYCSACHGPDGGGSIGPNLADEYWIHGDSLVVIHKTIAEGVLDKGMPAWGSILSAEQINSVTVYVASIAGTTPTAPKAPQGERRVPR